MIVWLAVAFVTVVIIAVALEVVLMRVSRYRLTHGDGRERAFRGARPQDPPETPPSPSGGG
jgi:hypothetical protein